MLQWVWEYFESAATVSAPPAGVHTLQGPVVHCTNALPLFLQHHGHSRTIIGIERRRKVGQKSQGMPALRERGGAGGAGRGRGRGGAKGCASCCCVATVRVTQYKSS